MTTYKSTESQQLWQHKSGQVLLLDAIAPLDETDVNAEYRYSSQGMDMGSESDFAAKGWVKIDECGYVGMPQAGEPDIFSLVEELVETTEIEAEVLAKERAQRDLATGVARPARPQ